jgi:hypothetical protein
VRVFLLQLKTTRLVVRESSRAWGYAGMTHVTIKSELYSTLRRAVNILPVMHANTYLHLRSG